MSNLHTLSEKNFAPRATDQTELPVICIIIPDLLAFSSDWPSPGYSCRWFSQPSPPSVSYLRIWKPPSNAGGEFFYKRTLQWII